MERDKIWNLLQFGMEIQTNDHNSTSEQIPNCFFNSDWDNSVDQSDPFKSGLSSIVSSPATSSLGIPANISEQQNVVLRELIGRLGSICNSGDISPHSFMGGYTTTTNNNSTNTFCYTTPLNSPPRLNLSVIDHQTRVRSLSNQLPSDPGLVKRAAKFSCHGGSQMGIEENKDGFLSILSRSSSPQKAEFGDSLEESLVSEIGIKGQRDVNAKKRKSISRGKSKEMSSAPYTKEAKAAAETEQSNSKRSKGDEVNQKESKETSKALEPLKDYIHVRARRGQATDSHSLAERVRREKISERMKFLQDLVPGCNKVTGKAVMLDEIINYVQSLQHQVEFLSMKLSNVNPRLDLNVKDILSKNILQSCASLPQNIFATDASSAQTFPYYQGSILHSNMPNGTKSSLWNSSTTEICQNAGQQHPPVDGYNNGVAPKMSSLWDDDLQNVVQMGFGQN